MSILMVGLDVTDRVREQETLELHFREAIERVKKYRCLSNTLRLTQDENLSLVEVLSGIVASLPEAWRHPGITTARGEVWGRERSFGESPYEPVASISSDVIVSGEIVGEIEVSYHEERPQMSEGPFTAEERELLDSVAAHLGAMIERRSAEESLAKLRLFRHSLIDQANLWLMALDRDRNVVLWNRAAERTSGYARNEVIGNDRVWEMLFPDPDYRAEIVSRITEVTFGGDAVEDWETAVRAKDGTDRIVSWHLHRLIDDNDGTTLGIVALGRDITEHRAAASNG
jgi:PAS domain S-box-containing protein